MCDIFCIRHLHVYYIIFYYYDVICVHVYARVYVRVRACVYFSIYYQVLIVQA
jgi:hypothetical protein